MDVFSLASKTFQDNFSNLPNTNSFLTGSDSSNCDNFDPNPTKMFASNYPTNGEVSPPMKACNGTGHETDFNNNNEDDYCDDDELSSSGRKYSNRRATTHRRNRINERERDRMHQLCHAFEKLRTVLPYKRSKRGPNRQRMSKIATLLLAQNYIRTLEDMLRRPTEYTNTNATTAAAANMVSQALAAAGVPANNPYGSYDTNNAMVPSSATLAGNGAMIESSYPGGIHGPGMTSVPAQDTAASQYYYMDYRDYHDYSRVAEHRGPHRVFAAEHAYPYL